MSNDRSLWAVLDCSAPGRAIAFITSAIDAARSQSRAHQWQLDSTARFSAMPAAARMRAIGVTLISAVAMHGILMWSAGSSGLWWMIVPALFGTFGLLLLLLAHAGRS